ncbi:hypothetical protein [Haloplanus rallus]|uniref:hypothetical protein n=1 Tax=Haloplanus rallus TaxID=1816183 RepID=UPI0018EE7B58|nr:hypothetical protein [Haloplanus rallus]
MRSFLVEQGLIESELDTIIEETWADANRFPHWHGFLLDSIERCTGSNVANWSSARSPPMDEAWPTPISATR